MEALLTTAEVAQVLKFSPRTVREMIARGEIKAVRWGRQWRVNEESLAKPEAKPARPQMSKQARMEEEAWEARRNRRVS